MSFIKFLPVLALGLPVFTLGLAACGSKADDTSDPDFEDKDSGAPSEPAAAPTSEPPATSFDIEFVGAYGMVTVENSVEIAGPAILNGENGPQPL